jgi:hypothetical protein
MILGWILRAVPALEVLQKCVADGAGPTKRRCRRAEDPPNELFIPSGLEERHRILNKYVVVAVENGNHKPKRPSPTVQKQISYFSKRFHSSATATKLPLPSQFLSAEIPSFLMGDRRAVVICTRTQ